MSSQALAERGHEAVVDDGWLVLEDGYRFGLDNLARNLATVPDRTRDWIEVIAGHFDSLLASRARADSANDPVEDVLARTYLRLYPVDMFPPDMLAERYHREVLPDVVEVLVEDFPESVDACKPELIARCGLQRMLDAGAANLASVRYDEHQDAHGMHMFTGESMYVSTVGRDLPWVARNWLGGADLSHGALVGLPDRHTLIVYLPRTAAETVNAVQVMTGMTAEFYEKWPGAISPFVYWWSDGSYEQLSRTDDDRLVVDVSPAFQAMLEGLPED